MSIKTTVLETGELPAEIQLPVDVSASCVSGCVSNSGRTQSVTAGSNGATYCNDESVNSQPRSAKLSHVEHQHGLSQQLLCAQNINNLRQLVSMLKNVLDKGQLKYVPN